MCVCLDSEEHLLVLQLADQRQAEVLSWGRSQTGGLARRRSGTSGRHDPVVLGRRCEAQRRRRKGGGALRQHRIAEFLIFVYISKPNTMSDQNLWCRRLEPPGHCRRSEEEEGADSSEFPPRTPSSSNFTSPAQMFAKRLHQMD